MSAYELVPFDWDQPPLRLEAEEHALEGASHVFRRTVLVMGVPCPVVVRRVPAALVAEVREVPAADDLPSGTDGRAGPVPG